MKGMLFALGVLTTLLGIAAVTSEAWARCPPGTMYQCYQGMGGKVVCGCR